MLHNARAAATARGISIREIPSVRRECVIGFEMLDAEASPYLTDPLLVDNADLDRVMPAGSAGEAVRDRRGLGRARPVPGSNPELIAAGAGRLPGRAPE